MPKRPDFSAMRLRFILLFVCLASLLCNKNRFGKIEAEYQLVAIDANKLITLWNEDSSQQSGKIPATALHTLKGLGIKKFEAQQGKFFLLQVECPAGGQCTGKKAFIHMKEVLLYSMEQIPFSSEFEGKTESEARPAFMLAKPVAAKNLTNLRDWLIKPGHSDIPQVFNSHVFDSVMDTKDNLMSYDRVGRVVQEMNEGKSSSPNVVKVRDLGQHQKAFIADLSARLFKKYDEIIEQEVFNFPYKHQTFKAIASALNGGLKPEYLRRRIMCLVLNESVFHLTKKNDNATVKEPAINENILPATVKVEAKADLLNEVRLNLSVGTETKIQIDEKVKIIAVVAPEGIGFEISNGAGEVFTLSPTQKLIYLISGSKSELKKLIAGFPDDKAILEQYPLDLALLRLIMKHGDGPVDAVAGYLAYELKLSKGKNFNIVLGALKKQFGTASEDQFSGKIDDQVFNEIFGAFSTKGQVNWYQQYAKPEKLFQFGIKGKIKVCQVTCLDQNYDDICLTNTETLRVNFRPTVLKLQKSPEYPVPNNPLQAEKPNLPLVFSSPALQSGSCEAILGLNAMRSPASVVYPTPVGDQ